LDEFVELRKELEPHGIGMKDIKSVARMLANAREKKSDVTKLLRAISEIENLAKTATEKKEEVEARTRELSLLGRKFDKLKDDANRQMKLLRQAQSLKSLGLDSDRLSLLHSTITRISKKYNMSERTGVKKFFADIRTQYDPKLGFEKKLDRLKDKLSTGESEIQKQEQLIEKTQKQQRDLIDALEAIRFLNKSEVTANDILAWNNAFAKIEKPPSEFLNDLNRYATTEKVIRSQIENRDALKSEIESLSGRKAVLESNLSNITTSIVTLHQVGNEKRYQTKRDLISGMIEVKDKAGRQLGDFSSEVSKIIQDTKSSVEGLQPTVQRMQESDKVLVEFGKLEALKLLLDLQAGRKVVTNDLLASILVLTVSFRKWLSKDPDLELKLKGGTDSFLSALREQEMPLKPI
jgi:predicted  nucleic acid-binding Zn-ribbon protein